MSTDAIDGQQHEHHQSVAGSIDEEARRHAEGHNQQAADQWTDHPSRGNDRIVQRDRIGQILVSREILDEGEQRRLVEAHHQAEQQGRQPDHPELDQVSGNEQADDDGQ
jgi:hypothetical protein